MLSFFVMGYSYINLKMKFHVLLLFCYAAILPVVANSQTVKFKVVDTDTNEGLPFTCIATSNNQRGCYTDMDGIFYANSNDTVNVSSLGYHTKSITLSDIPINGEGFKIIKLERRVFEIKEVAVYGRSQRRRVPYEVRSFKNTRQKGVLYNIPGGQIAAKVPNHTYQFGLLEQVAFKLKVDGKRKTAALLRLRIYAANENKSTPQESLLNETIPIGIRSGWVTIDLSKHLIPFTKEGVFVGLEWIDPDNKLEVKQERTEPGICYYFEKNNFTSIEKHKNGEWKKDRFASELGGGCFALKVSFSVPQ